VRARAINPKPMLCYRSVPSTHEHADGHTAVHSALSTLPKPILLAC
jgi:hypothetical protein